MTEPRKTEITQQRLRELLDYDVSNGAFTWRTSNKRRIKAGQTAGSYNKVTGYLSINCDNMSFLVHRLVWIYMYGDIPVGMYIDHVDNDKLNNRIENLRLCTKLQNKQNSSVSEKSKSGIKGVYWIEKLGKYLVCVGLNGKMIKVGYYTNKEDAITASNNARLLHHGEFAKII